MRTRTLAIFFLPLLLGAQQASVPPASWKDLKFPPLKEIKIPKIEDFTHWPTV